ncbi:MAG: M20/M25/M40 family metallo-hydrolase [Synergistaceae bacterium]|nr:M20/M25/M40 family metallo-hydrolase [Synergistaceae bacterium]
MECIVPGERIEELMREFVAAYSPTGTGEENVVRGFYRSWFESVPYFRENRDEWGFFEIPGDPVGRAVPWGIIRGEGSGAVVLFHHSDVVDTDDYGELAPKATSPDELGRELAARRASIDTDASRDLDSGEWIFGRGTADMKGGAAVQLAMCERYAQMSERGELRGNVVILGLPDEENLNAGGRAAPLILKRIMEGNGFNYRMAINAEPTDRTLGTDKPKLFVSSIGKILPVIYARGALSHAGRVFEGLNPIKIMAHVVRRLDLNEEFIDSAEGIVSCPAAFLFARDGKEAYDVSLPMYAFGCMNVMFLEKSVRGLLDFIVRECGAAFCDAVADTSRSHAAYLGRSGEAERALPWKPAVKLYSSLYEEALRDSGDKFRKAIESLTAELGEKIARGVINQVEASREVIEATLIHAADPSPVIVVALAPPYCPVVSNSMLSESDFADKICNMVIGEAREKFGDEYVPHCLVGMSDFSYLLRNPRETDSDYIRDNMLLWGDIYSIPFEEIGEISMPIMNIGPWGKGIHTRLERVWKEDLYRRTPHLLDFTVRAIFDN